MATGFNYMPQSVGGSEVSTDALCRGAMAAGHTCAVVCALAPTGDTLYVMNRLKSKIYRKAAPSDTVNGYRVYRGWQTKASLREVCEGFRPDVVVVQSGETAKIVTESLALGYPTVVYVRDVEFDTHGGVYPNHPRLRAIANSSFTANSLEAKYGLTAVTLPPSLDRADYYVEPEKRTHDCVLFVNPHPVKGLDLALELARENPDIPFRFLRSWRLDRQMEMKVVSAVEALSNVQLMESVGDMKPIYAKSRVVLVPSVWGEAWCRVVSEAQVCGVPALASRVGGLPESIGIGGILLDPGSPLADWSHALRKLWCDEDYWRTLSSRAVEMSNREELSPDYTTNGMLSVCEEVVRLSA